MRGSYTQLVGSWSMRRNLDPRLLVVNDWIFFGGGWQFLDIFPVSSCPCQVLFLPFSVFFFLPVVNSVLRFYSLCLLHYSSASVSGGGCLGYAYRDHDYGWMTTVGDKYCATINQANLLPTHHALQGEGGSRDTPFTTPPIHSPPDNKEHTLVSVWEGRGGGHTWGCTVYKNRSVFRIVIIGSVFESSPDVLETKNRLPEECDEKFIIQLKEQNDSRRTTQFTPEKYNVASARSFTIFPLEESAKCSKKVGEQKTSNNDPSFFAQSCSAPRYLIWRWGGISPICFVDKCCPSRRPV